MDMRVYSLKGLTNGTHQQGINAGGGKKRYDIQMVTRQDSDGDVNTVSTGTLVINGAVVPIENLAGTLQTHEVVASLALNTTTNWIQTFDGAYNTLEFVVATLEAAHTLDIFVKVSDA